MDHPVTHEGQKDLRKRVIQFLSSSYYVRRESNILFVCGGKSDEHMRIRFRSYCIENLNEFDVFFPEYAMDNYFAGDVEEPFDLADFEQLIGELSHAIIIFPEAAGSYAETGYFSAIPELAKRSVLVLDTAYQAEDSFISMGPSKKFASQSIYQPAIQISYNDPNFDVIAERVKRTNKKKYKKKLVIEKFSNTPAFQLFCLIFHIVDILTITTFDDIIYILRGIYSGHVSVVGIRKVTSILAGSSYINEIGELGHFHRNHKKPDLLTIVDGAANELKAVRLELANLYQSADADFMTLLEASAHVD